MSRSSNAKNELESNSAQFIEKEIKEFVLTSPFARLQFMNGYAIWTEPIVKFANGDDPIFTEYKNIIAPVHFSPREALARSYEKKPQDLPAHLSVISWILPVAEETRKSNRAETQLPSRLWSHTRWYGEECNDKLRAHIVELLTSMGYLATAPGMLSLCRMYKNEKGLYSDWSERHIAYAAGQGTFSLSDGFITESGIAHRCGSVVTDLVLPPNVRTAKTPFSNCLFYRGTKCKACIERCPAGAITESGHDKNKCLHYMNEIGYVKVVLKHAYDNDKDVAGCGLCQVKVPCEFRNPTRKMKPE